MVNKWREEVEDYIAELSVEQRRKQIANKEIEKKCLSGENTAISVKLNIVNIKD